MAENKNDTLLSIKDLKVEYASGGKIIEAVNGVTLTLSRGASLGLVGETGAGKTTIAKAIMRILPDHATRLVEGEITFDGVNILEASDSQLQKIRGGDISMVFQDPMTALNPIMTVGDQIAEGIALHKTFPDAGLDLLSSFDERFRPACVEFARKKAAQSQAPTYLYDFALQFQLMGGVYAWHCSDIPFVFHNSHRVPCCNIPSVTETLEDQMAGAWVRFAYSGNPNHAGMPAWEAFGENETTMVFDGNTRCCPDFDTELIAQIEKAIGKVEYVSPPLRKLDASGEKKRDWMY